MNRLEFRKYSGVRRVILVTLFILTSLAGLYIFVSEPYWRYRETRHSAEPETITVIYWGYQQIGDHPDIGYCPHFTQRFLERVRMTNGTFASLRIDLALSLAFAYGSPSPEDEGLTVGGNQFRITGYRYDGFEVNVLTGRQRKVPYPPQRFDVVTWEVMAPYGIFGRATDSAEREIVESDTESKSYSLEGPDDGPEQFAVPEDRFCLIHEEHLAVWNRNISLGGL